MARVKRQIGLGFRFFEISRLLLVAEFDDLDDPVDFARKCRSVCSIGKDIFFRDPLRLRRIGLL